MRGKNELKEHDTMDFQDHRLGDFWNLRDYPFAIEDHLKAFAPIQVA